MQLITPVKIPEYSEKISYNDITMLMGSCFTENIGEKLGSYKFKADINPFGILYNPLSVEKAIRILIHDVPFAQSDLFFFNEQWNSYMHHSRFSHTNMEQCLENINNRLNLANKNLKSAKFLFITFGTAWAYKLKSSGNIVANCHKVPAREFTRLLLTPQQIVDKYNLLLNDIQNLNPRLNIIFTISPVRHLKDGAHGNQVSKSTLLLAVNELVSRHSNSYYFPSYEIVMDELRDYRFYADDLVHISAAGVQYIWEKFAECFTNENTRGIMKKVNEIASAVSHRPFNKNAGSYKAFCVKTLEKITAIQQIDPGIDFDAEEKYFKGMM